jgi:hypothetical protein
VRNLFATTGVLLCLTAAQAADTKPTPEALEFFEKKIRPVLVERCYTCHSAASRALMGALMLDTAEGWKRGGKSGRPSVVPNEPERSVMLTAMRHEGPLKMPPGPPLPPEIIADFEKWITMGAPRSAHRACETSSAALQFRRSEKVLVVPAGYRSGAA